MAEAEHKLVDDVLTSRERVTDFVPYSVHPCEEGSSDWQQH
jgi:hypothetical protein